MHFELQYVIFIWAKTTTTTTQKQKQKNKTNKKKGEKGMNTLCSINCELKAG